MMAYMNQIGSPDSKKKVRTSPSDWCLAVRGSGQ